jgi:hypothetical protein
LKEEVMSQDVYEKLLATPVVDNGTIVFSYKAGKTADNYASTGHYLYVDKLQAKFPVANDGIGVVFGGSDITITYKGATTLPALSKVSFNGALKTFEPVEGDLEMANLNVTDDLTVGDDLTVTGDIHGEIAVADNVGEGGTDVVVGEYGDGINHTTVLTLVDFEVHATEPDNADLAVGGLLYTLPAGSVLVKNTYLNITVAKEGEPTIADGEIALGTTQGSTAVDTTGEVDAAAENLMTPIVLSTSEFDGAEVYEFQDVIDLFLAEAADKTVYLNIAATWPDVTPAGAILANGTVVIEWTYLAPPAA